MGLCKLVLGVRGHVVYAWRRIPEEELTDCSAADRRVLARFGVVQGVFGLAFGAAVGAICAWPLVNAVLP